MINWKAVTIALTLALGWLMGDPAVAMGPGPDPQAEVQLAVSRVDSLLTRLREHPDEVQALEQLAAMYAANESYDAAIGSLARALQLDPSRRSLWVALDNALAHSGTASITDTELVKRAVAFRAAMSTN
jgi:cytochrome c-type biogenesis protein CcmH/NrfG